MKITDLNSPNAQQIQELRRSEREQMPAPDKLAEVGHGAAVEFLKSIPASERDRYVVTMTTLPKVGVNPRSEYNTPIGVYFYPAEYYMRRAAKGGLPFQDDAPYIQILKLTTDQILDLGKVSASAYAQDLQKIMNLDLITRLDAPQREEIQQLDSSKHARVKTPGGRLWYVMWKVSDILEEQYQKSSHVIWNWILRQLGYKVVIDLGNKIIHQNEPTQGVILDSVGSYRWIKTIHNVPDIKFRQQIKKNFSQMDNQQRARFVRALSLHDKRRYIEKYPQLINFLNDPAEIEGILKTYNTAKAIKYIPNPSERMQLAAVQANGSVIRWIDQPSEAVQLAAVRNHGMALQYITNPSDRVVAMAVNDNGEAIRFVENPSEEIQALALRDLPVYIKYIKNPTKKIQEYAVRMDAGAIQYIKNPSKQLQLAAVREHGAVIQYIPNPTRAMKIAAVKSMAESLKYIPDPDPELLLIAVRFNPRAIKYIKNPSEDLKFEAIRNQPVSFRFIKNPTEEMQLLAAALNISTIEILLDQGIMPSQAVVDAAIAAFPDEKSTILRDIRKFKAKQKKKSTK